MELKKGDKFYIAGDAHMIDGIVDDEVYVERLHDNSLKKYTYTEVQSLVEESRKKGWFKGPWPLVITHYVYDDEKFPMDEELIEKGIAEEDRLKFRHIAHDIGLQVELHKNGDVYVLAIDNQQLENKIKIR